MTELVGNGAITQEYLYELQGKNPDADILKIPLVIQDAQLEQIFNKQENAS